MYDLSRLRIDTLFLIRNTESERSARYTPPMFRSVLLSLLLAATPQIAQVVTINDGDTITVRIDGHTDQVRLVGIDAPESRDNRADYRHAANAAKNHARTLMAGETVTLEPEPRQSDRDKYGRLLRYVILDDGTNVNEALVRGGYARVYTRFNFTLKPRFKLAEDEAKRGRLGLWALPPGPSRDVPAPAPAPAPAR